MVVYLILVKGLKKVIVVGPGQNGVYAGKSINVGNRLGKHAAALNGAKPPKGHMYSRARGAESWRMVVWTDLSGLPQDQADAMLQIAEQTAVCLFATITPTLNHLDDLSTIVSYYFDYLATRRFQTLANKVFNKTGWEPRPAVGLNWTSPMMESMNMHTAWTRQDAPLEDGTTVRIYRRGPLKVGNKGRLQLIAGGADGRGRVTVIVPYSFPNGSVVVPSVEIYTGHNKRHPKSFASVPEPGPWTDWGNCNRLGKCIRSYNDLAYIIAAISVEGGDKDGNPIKEYLVGRRSFSYLGWAQSRIRDCPPGYIHASALYFKVQCIHNTLMLAKYPAMANVQPWVKQGPPIVVKKFDYDHLTRTITITHQNPIQVPKPELLSFQDNELILHSMYGPHLIVGDGPSMGLGFVIEDKLDCSMCTNLSAQDVPGAQRGAQAGSLACMVMPKVESGPWSEQREASCPRCFFLRRPCVWVPSYDLNARGGRFQYIRPPHRDMEGPKPLTTQIRPIIGPTAEEIVFVDVEDTDDDNDDDNEAAEQFRAARVRPGVQRQWTI